MYNRGFLASLCTCSSVRARVFLQVKGPDVKENFPSALTNTLSPRTPVYTYTYTYIDKIKCSLLSSIQSSHILRRHSFFRTLRFSAAFSSDAYNSAAQIHQKIAVCTVVPSSQRNKFCKFQAPNFQKLQVPSTLSTAHFKSSQLQIQITENTPYFKRRVL